MGSRLVCSPSILPGLDSSPNPNSTCKHVLGKQTCSILYVEQETTGKRLSWLGCGTGPGPTAGCLGEAGRDSAAAAGVPPLGLGVGMQTSAVSNPEPSHLQLLLVKSLLSWSGSLSALDLSQKFSITNPHQVALLLSLRVCHVLTMLPNCSLVATKLLNL